MISRSRATLPGRLTSKLVRTGDCFVWTGAARSGYGAISLYEDGQQTILETHRVAYELVKGPIPEGMWIDHLCRNTLCANPYHLEVVTPGENTRRSKLFMLAPACRNDHPWEPGSFVIRPNGTKRCLACRAEWRARRKEAT